MTHFENLIIGGGPAGTGLLLKAMKDGTLLELLDLGIAVIEKSDNLLKGSIINYQIHSDTLSDAFLECLEGMTENYIDISTLRGEIEFVNTYKGKSIPLNYLSGLLNKIGLLLYSVINDHPKCRVLLNTEVLKIEETESGYLTVHLNNIPALLTANKIILASGGKSIGLDDLKDDYGKRLSLTDFGAKMFHSDKLLKGELEASLASLVKPNFNVVILGSSHSAFSSAYYLLHKYEDDLFGRDSIKIYCNRKPKIFFATKEEAIQMNYLEFTEDDFCPVTNRLYRLAGLRMKSRELFMEMEGMYADKHEERVILKYNNEAKERILNDLMEADLIILALGYKFNFIPIYNRQGQQIRLIGEVTGRWVNQECALLDAENQVIPNIFAVGLASGYIPGGKLGGEPSFKGQTNGIWYYQNVIGEIVLEKLLPSRKSEVV